MLIRQLAQRPVNPLAQFARSRPAVGFTVTTGICRSTPPDSSSIASMDSVRCRFCLRNWSRHRLMTIRVIQVPKLDSPWNWRNRCHPFTHAS